MKLLLVNCGSLPCYSESPEIGIINWNNPCCQPFLVVQPRKPKSWIQILLYCKVTVIESCKFANASPLPLPLHSRKLKRVNSEIFSQITFLVWAQISFIRVLYGLQFFLLSLKTIFTDDIRLSQKFKISKDSSVFLLIFYQKIFYISSCRIDRHYFLYSIALLVQFLKLFREWNMLIWLPFLSLFLCILYYIASFWRVFNRNWGPSSKTQNCTHSRSYCHLELEYIVIKRFHLTILSQTSNFIILIWQGTSGTAFLYNWSTGPRLLFI